MSSEGELAIVFKCFPLDAIAPEQSFDNTDKNWFITAVNEDQMFWAVQTSKNEPFVLLQVPDLEDRVTMLGDL